MTTPQQVLAVAVSQLGYKENPAGSNRTKFGAWYGMDGNPWCAMFVSWCFDQAKMPIPITTPKGYSYCPAGVSWFRRAGKLSVTPTVGAIVFYGTGGLAEHTGIVESFDSNNIVAIEGNTSTGSDADGGEVMRRARPRNSWIIGYGSPTYTDEVTPMFNPPIVLRPIVAVLACPSGGFWQLGDDGSVYAWAGAPFKGGVNGKLYFSGRTPATLELPKPTDAVGSSYIIVATSGERYAPTGS